LERFGVREAGRTGAYTAWVLVLYEVFLPATFLTLSRRLIVHLPTRDTWKASAVGWLP
jgi:hypothetical protein